MKTVLVDGGTNQYKDITEINRSLLLVIDELNLITRPETLSEEKGKRTNFMCEREGDKGGKVRWL